MSELQITQVNYKHDEDPELREITIELSDGVVITAESCHESYQQWGGTEDHLWFVQPIVEAHNDWLHGGELPFGGSHG